MDEKKYTPTHVALIPDGNRRWAQARGESPWYGHEKGAERLEELLGYIHKSGVRYFTVWGSSVENLQKRPLKEKKALLQIYQDYFKKLRESDVIHERGVRIHVVGQWRAVFPQSLCALIDDVQAQTEENDTNHLTILLAYSGDDDMVRAVQALVARQDVVTAETLKSALTTCHLPPVDLMIRTGGEPHMSAGFMMWEIANAEFYFTEKLFPDFDTTTLDTALSSYAARRRKKGS